MAHIVCITSGLTSTLNASLALVERLAAEGHRITYASPSDVKATVTAQGVDYIQLAPWVIQSVDEDPMSRWEKLRKLRSRQEKAVEALGVGNFVATMRSLQPDLLLIHIEMHPHIMAAVSAGFRVALLCTFVSIWRRPHLPPIHTEILPGIGWRGQRYGIEWAWWRYSWRKWKEFQRDRWQRVGLDKISVLRRYASQLNYPFRSRFGFTQWIVPYPHRPLPILCCNALELDFPHKAHPLMHYIGPMVQKNRQEISSESSENEKLQQLLAVYSSRDENKCEGHQRFLIYCGCSSMLKSDRQRLNRILEAVANRKDWELILGLGRQLMPAQLGALPQNVHAFRWAPQLEILKYADCAIVDAGSSALRECIAAGVPMLVYSRGNNDQNGNKARVVYHQLGIGGDRNKDSASQIRQHIEKLLTNRTYQERVNAMRDRCQRYDRENRTAKVVAQLLSSHSSHLHTYPSQQIRKEVTP